MYVRAQNRQYKALYVLGAMTKHSIEDVSYVELTASEHKSFFIYWNTDCHFSVFAICYHIWLLWHNLPLLAHIEPSVTYVDVWL